MRLAALESIAKIRTPEAALVLLEAVRQETGAIRQAAEARLSNFGGDEVAMLLREARDVEVGDRRDVLDRLLAGRGLRRLSASCCGRGPRRRARR